MIRLAILGATGSIGRQTIDVAMRFPDSVSLVGLTANTDADGLASLADATGVGRVALADAESARKLADARADLDVLGGAEAVVELGTGDDVDVVLNALVGAAGLRATASVLQSGKRLALANKESLVVGGELITSLVGPGQLLPVDSEHSALFQCLTGEDPGDVARIWLTASGGPFRGRSRDELVRVSVEEALAHPRWTMGPKITVDSATLMNKGLEAIEAHHLFGVDYDRISVVVHPRSCVHSMIEFVDGSVKAHLGATDMRIPIQYALSYPARWGAPVEPVDFATLGSLDFEPPDIATFRCLALALEAGREGGTAPAAMNAANEVGVAGFLAGGIGFLDIERVVEETLSAHQVRPLESLEQIERVDAEARDQARRVLERVSDQ